MAVRMVPLWYRRATRSLSENSTSSDTDPGAMVPSGSSAGVAFDDDVANTPGPGQRRHPVRAHPLVDPLPLVLALTGCPLDVGQHHGAGGRDDQQRAGQLEREQVVGEQHRGDRTDGAAVDLRARAARRSA